MNYLEAIYSERRRPKTNYPQKLARYLFERFSIEKNAKILDIGSGRGELITAFKKLGLECSAVDRERGDELKEIDFKMADLEKEALPFPDNSFDVVYHKSVIEHFYSPEKILGESKRVLKPGGKIIVLTPDWESQFKNFYEDITHKRPYTETGLADALKIYGFDNVSSEKFYQLPILWKIPLLKILSKISALFLPVMLARKITKITGIKFFRFSSELMLLGFGQKPSK